jgi:hypothetical protein
VIEKVIDQYSELVGMLQTPGVTMAEIRERFGSDGEGGEHG